MALLNAISNLKEGDLYAALDLDGVTESPEFRDTLFMKNPDGKNPDGKAWGRIMEQHLTELLGIAGSSKFELMSYPKKRKNSKELGGWIWD